MCAVYVNGVNQDDTESSVVDAKGDLLVGSAADTLTRIAVGADGTVPVANAGDTAGVGWAYSGASGLLPVTAALTSLKCATYDPTLIVAVGQSLTDAQIRACAVYLPYDATITGAVWQVNLQGNYTADNNNKIGLYASDGTTLTLVAATASADTLWSASVSTVVKQSAFATPYAAQAGVYWIACLYNSSAQTTAPSLATKAAGLSGNQHDVLMSDTDEFVCWALSAQSDLPASQAWSGVVASGANMFLGLY